MILGRLKERAACRFFRRKLSIQNYIKLDSKGILPSKFRFLSLPADTTIGI